MAALFANFIAGYEDFVRQTPGADYRENLWEDHRYEGDKDPDESLYLDASTTPPAWPSAYVAPDK
jgi:hypothetical protein